MSWHGAVGLSLTSRACPAADSSNLKTLHTERCARRTAPSVHTHASFLAQVPLFRFVVDLLDNKSYNKLYNISTCQVVVHFAWICRAGFLVQEIHDSSKWSLAFNHGPLILSLLRFLSWDPHGAGQNSEKDLPALSKQTPSIEFCLSASVQPVISRSSNFIVLSTRVCVFYTVYNWTLLQTGECRCQPGYQGEQCERRCDDGYYGDGCRHRCRCRRHEKCDFVTGACTSNCPPGWIGDDCSQGTSRHYTVQTPGQIAKKSPDIFWVNPPKNSLNNPPPKDSPNLIQF